MTDITVRHIDFKFESDIDFHWNPTNHEWGNFVNLVTIVVPAFEKFAIRITRESIPKIQDAELAVQADLFCKQEAQHSRMHMAHLKVLTDQHQGLQEVADRVMDSYNALMENESLEFCLAYAAYAELYLGPMAQFVVENRHELMGEADPRIASFILWHFIEEFEHKNAAIDIYNAVVGSYWFRMKSFPKIAKHLAEVTSIVLTGMEECVPQKAGAPKNSSLGGMFSTVSLGKVVKLYYLLFCTVLPYHKPDNIKAPEWLQQWHRDYNAGLDMAEYFPA